MQGSPTSWPWISISCQISRSISLEIKCTKNVMHSNHPQTTPHPHSVEKLSSTKLVLDAKRLGTANSNGSGQSKLKTFYKGFTILEGIKKIQDSWEEVKMSVLTTVWKKLILTLKEDFWGIRYFSRGSYCKHGGNSKRTRIRSGAWICGWIAAIS